MLLQFKKGINNMKQVKDEKNKDKALEQVLADIEKQFGAGAIMKLGRCLLYTSWCHRKFSKTNP